MEATLQSSSGSSGNSDSSHFLSGFRFFKHPSLPAVLSYAPWTDESAGSLTLDALVEGSARITQQPVSALLFNPGNAVSMLQHMYTCMYILCC
jgi:hypothetical protein